MQTGSMRMKAVFTLSFIWTMMSACNEKSKVLILRGSQTSQSQSALGGSIESSIIVTQELAKEQGTAPISGENNNNENNNNNEVVTTVSPVPPALNFTSEKSSGPISCTNTASVSTLALGSSQLPTQECFLSVYPLKDRTSHSIDILFVVDTSDTLKEERREISQQVDDLLSQIPTSMRYRIAITLMVPSTSKFFGKLYSYTPKDQCEKGYSIGSTNKNHLKECNNSAILDSAQLSQSKIADTLKLYLTHIKGNERSKNSVNKNGLLGLSRLISKEVLAKLRLSGFLQLGSAWSVVFVSNRNEICRSGDKKCDQVSISNKMKTFADLNLGKPIILGAFSYLGESGLKPLRHQYTLKDLMESQNGLFIDMNSKEFANGLFHLGKKLLHQIFATGTVGRFDFELPRGAVFDISSISVKIGGKDTRFSLKNDGKVLSVEYNENDMNQNAEIQYCLNSIQVQNPSMGENISDASQVCPVITHLTESDLNSASYVAPQVTSTNFNESPPSDSSNPSYQTSTDTPVITQTVASTTISSPTVADTSLSTSTVANTTISSPTVSDTSLATSTVADTTISSPTVLDTSLSTSTVASTTISSPTVLDTSLSTSTVADTTISSPTVADTSLSTSTVSNTTTTSPTVADTSLSTSTVSNTTTTSPTVSDTSLSTDSGEASGLCNDIFCDGGFAVLGI